MRASLFDVRPDHGMETILDPREYLGIPPQDVHDIVIRLLDYTEVPGKQLRPARETSPVMWGSEEDDPACGAEDVSDVCRPVFCGHQSVFANQSAEAVAHEYDRPFVLSASYHLLSVLRPRHAYRVIILPVRCERRWQVARVIRDPTLRNHALPASGKLWYISK